MCAGFDKVFLNEIARFSNPEAETALIDALCRLAKGENMTREEIEIKKAINILSDPKEEIPIPIPWYEDSYKQKLPVSKQSEEFLKMSPKEIFRELSRHVIGQDEACKSVAIMVYQHIRGHRSVNMLAGPTGCGKSFIAETLRNIFDFVYIRDISNLTQDGWSGGCKISTILKDLETYNVPPFLVLDEADKCFNYKSSSGGGSPSQDVQSELLSVIQGTEFPLDKKASKVVDTSKMSFLFSGSFDRQAKTIAQERSGGFGFGQNIEKAEEYAKPVTMEDVHNSGCIRELCGRIENLFPLYPISQDTFRNMLNDRKAGPRYELENEFGIKFKISETAKDEICQEAISSKLGVRYIKKTLRSAVDEAVWEQMNPKVVEVG